MKTTIWVRYPLAMRVDQFKRIEKALRITFGIEVKYYYDYCQNNLIHFLDLSGVSKATAQAIAMTVKAFHTYGIEANVYRAETERKEHIEKLLVEISPERPAWASAT